MVGRSHDAITDSITLKEERDMRPPRRTEKLKRKTPRSFQGGQGRSSMPGSTYLWLNSRLGGEHADHLEEIVSELQSQYFRARSTKKRQAIAWRIHVDTLRYLLSRFLRPRFMRDGVAEIVRRILS